MVRVPEGTAQIGSPQSEADRDEDEDEQHSVTLASFLMGRFPITQAQWHSVSLLPTVKRSLDPHPSAFKGLNRPVDQGFWFDAIEFCARLSAATGRFYRLPTEVEWEYACRGAATMLRSLRLSQRQRQEDYQ